MNYLLECYSGTMKFWGGVKCFAFFDINMLTIYLFLSCLI